MPPPALLTQARVQHKNDGDLPDGTKAEATDDPETFCREVSALFSSPPRGQGIPLDHFFVNACRKEGHVLPQGSCV